jgi:hypothetical protein
MHVMDIRRTATIAGWLTLLLLAPALAQENTPSPSPVPHGVPVKGYALSIVPPVEPSRLADGIPLNVGIVNVTDAPLKVNMRSPGYYYTFTAVEHANGKTTTLSPSASNPELLRDFGMPADGTLVAAHDGFMMKVLLTDFVIVKGPGIIDLTTTAPLPLSNGAGDLAPLVSNTVRLTVL